MGAERIVFEEFAKFAKSEKVLVHSHINHTKGKTRQDKTLFQIIIVTFNLLDTAQERWEPCSSCFVYVLLWTCFFDSVYIAFKLSFLIIKINRGCMLSNESKKKARQYTHTSIHPLILNQQPNHDGYDYTYQAGE